MPLKGEAQLIDGEDGEDGCAASVKGAWDLGGLRLLRWVMVGSCTLTASHSQVSYRRHASQDRQQEPLSLTGSG